MNATLQDKSYSDSYPNNHPSSSAQYANHQSLHQSQDPDSNLYLTSNAPYSTSTRHEPFGLNLQRVSQTGSGGNGGGENEIRDSLHSNQSEDDQQVGQRDSMESNSTINSSFLQQQQQQQRQRPPGPEISPRRTRSKRLSLVKNLDPNSNPNSPNFNSNSNSMTMTNSTPSSSRSSSRSRKGATASSGPTLDTPPTSANLISNDLYRQNKLNSPHSIDVNLANSSPSKMRMNLDGQGQGQDGNPNHGSFSAPANLLSFSNTNTQNNNSATSTPYSNSSFNHHSDPTSQNQPPSPNANSNSLSASSSNPFLTMNTSDPNCFTLSEQDENIQKKINSKFVYKVYKMCCDESCQAMINWSEDGNSIQIINLNETSKDILSRHFKHSNFSSFIRQLNMYGFYKVNKTNRNSTQAPGTKFPEGNVWEFSHPRFIRGRPDLLDGIKRRVPPDEVKSSSNAQQSEEKDGGGSSRERRASATGQKFSDNDSQPSSEFKRIPLSIGSSGSNGGLGIGMGSSEDSPSDVHTQENQQNHQIEHQFIPASGQFPSGQPAAEYPLQPQSSSYSNHPSNLQQSSMPIPVAGPSNSSAYHQQQHSHPQPQPGVPRPGGFFSSESLTPLERVREQNFHLGQCVFQLRESLIGLIDWIGHNGYNEGRLPFEVRIPTEQQIGTLLWYPENEKIPKETSSGLVGTNESGGLSAGIIENQLSSSPQDMNDGNSWSNSNNTLHHHQGNPGFYNAHPSNPTASSSTSTQHDSTRPEIFVTDANEPPNLDYYSLTGPHNNRSSNSSNWSVPSLASNSSGGSRSGSGSGSFSNDPNRRMSHVDTLTGGYSNPNEFLPGSRSDQMSGMVDQHGNVNRPFSAPPKKTSFGDVGGNRNGLTINTSNPNLHHSMNNHNDGSGIGLNGIGLGFNSSILSAVNTPLPPSPATIQTPNSSTFPNQFFLNNQHSTASLDSPMTPQTGQFTHHQNGFGNTYFNPNMMNFAHHQHSQQQGFHQHQLDPNSSFGLPLENEGLGINSRSNSMDDVRGRLSKVMRTENNLQGQNNLVGMGINENQLNQRRPSLNHSGMLSFDHNQKHSAPSSPGGVKRKSPN